jgi:hypothetical protein
VSIALVSLLLLLLTAVGILATGAAAVSFVDCFQHTYIAVKYKTAVAELHINN